MVHGSESDDFLYIYRNTILVTSIISFVAGSFIVLLYLIFGTLKKQFAFKLVVYIAISDMITTFARFLVLPTSSALSDDSLLCKT